MLQIDGFEEAIIGKCECWDGNEKVERLIYSGDGMVDALMLDGMDEEEALEYIDFNIDCAYMGKETPIIMWNYDD